MVDVTSDSHFQRTGKGLEDTLNLMMLVLSFGTNVQVHLSSIAETLEEVEEHLSRHVADEATVEFCIPDKPWTAAEIEADRAETVIHWQAVAIAFDATLVAESLQQAFA